MWCVNELPDGQLYECQRILINGAFRSCKSPSTERTCPAAHWRWQSRTLSQQRICDWPDDWQESSIDGHLYRDGAAGRTCRDIPGWLYQRVQAQRGAEAPGYFTLVTLGWRGCGSMIAGGPLIRVSRQTRMGSIWEVDGWMWREWWAMRVNLGTKSVPHQFSDFLQLCHREDYTRMNGKMCEWAAVGAWWIFPTD